MKSERTNDMKLKLIMILVLVAAFALPTMAQVGEQQPNDNQFRSTSTMVGSGSNYSATPTINASGTANAPTFGGGGPRYAPKPINDDSDWEDRKEDIGGGISTPVGDAVLPLMLMAMAYAVYSVARVYRRKRRL